MEEKTKRKKRRKSEIHVYCEIVCNGIFLLELDLVCGSPKCGLFFFLLLFLISFLLFVLFVCQTYVRTHACVYLCACVNWCGYFELYFNFKYGRSTICFACFFLLSPLSLSLLVFSFCSLYREFFQIYFSHRDLQRNNIRKIQYTQFEHKIDAYYLV